MLLPSLAEAEDAAQDSFVKAYESLEDFKGGSSFSTWVCRIAYNHCLDLLRRKSRQKTQSLEAFIEEKGEVSRGLWNESGEGGSSVDNRQALQDTLASVRAEYKEILILREVGELRYDEIAAQLKISLDAVKARLRRARHELQEKARHFSGSRVV
jgi:RNA polymerase sigma-70 factor (ECF subfamily)